MSNHGDESRTPGKPPRGWLLALIGLTLVVLLGSGFAVRLRHLPHPKEDHVTVVPALEPLAEGAAAGQEWDANRLKMKFCWCSPGEYRMGEPPDQVEVKLTCGFWLGKYEVTQAEYEQ